MKARLCVWIVCTGVGRVERGFETFAKECFHALSSSSTLQLSLLKGSGKVAQGEQILPSLDRNRFLARFLGRCFGRHAYVIEQWSSFFSMAWRIRKARPDVIFYSDSNLGFLLYRFRSLIGVPYKLLFSNGGPCHPPFDRCDAVQQVAPFYLKEALDAGEDSKKHYMVPYGIKVPGAPPAKDPVGMRVLRNELGLPPDRTVVLSVGWISRTHKRMDYLIEEFAMLREPRPFLQLVGSIDSNSVELIEYGRRVLGDNNFGVTSVTHQQVMKYYRAADLFVLASLQEGFGRVYLESLMHGLPTIAHRHAVMAYVLDKEGVLDDLDQPGNLTRTIAAQLDNLDDPRGQKALQRWESVRSRFSWEILVSQYEEMFQHVAG